MRTGAKRRGQSEFSAGPADFCNSARAACHISRKGRSGRPERSAEAAENRGHICGGKQHVHEREKHCVEINRHGSEFFQTIAVPECNADDGSWTFNRRAQGKTWFLFPGCRVPSMGGTGHLGGRFGVANRSREDRGYRLGGRHTGPWRMVAIRSCGGNWPGTQPASLETGDRGRKWAELADFFVQKPPASSVI